MVIRLLESLDKNACFFCEPIVYKLSLQRPFVIFILIKAHQESQAPLIRPQGNCTRRSSLDQADRQTLVQASQPLRLEYHAYSPACGSIHGDVVVDVLAPRGALHLDALAHEVEREDGRLGHDASHDAGGGVAAAPGEVQVAELQPQAFVRGEEDAHEGDDLGQRGSQAAEEAPEAFVALDVPQSTSKGGIHPVPALGGEPRPQQVKRVRHARGSRSGDGAGDKRLGRVGQAAVLGQRGLQKDGRGAVGGELGGRVADVHELGRDVALPEPREALVLEDVLDGVDGAAVGGGFAEGGEGVGEGVWLELEADLDDVEGGDEESRDEPGYGAG